MQAVTLTEFLLARIAEDEALLPEWFCGTRGQWRPILHVKAECEAKRRIVESMGDDWVTRVLATAHAGHTDYREEWKP